LNSSILRNSAANKQLQWSFVTQCMLIYEPPASKNSSITFNNKLKL